MKEFLVHSVFFGAAVSLIGYESGLLLTVLLKKKSADDYKLSQYFHFLILPYNQLVVPVDYKKDFFLCQEFFTLYPL